MQQMHLIRSPETARSFCVAEYTALPLPGVCQPLTPSESNDAAEEILLRVSVEGHDCAHQPT